MSEFEYKFLLKLRFRQKIENVTEQITSANIDFQHYDKITHMEAGFTWPIHKMCTSFLQIDITPTHIHINELTTGIRCYLWRVGISIVCYEREPVTACYHLPQKGMFCYNRIVT